MNEETTQQIPDHSHDSMYLVYHFRSGEGPDYESCHHCSFIKVPKLEEITAQLAEEKRSNEHLRGTVEEQKEIISLQKAEISIEMEKRSRIESEVKEQKTAMERREVEINDAWGEIERLESEVKELKKRKIIYSPIDTELKIKGLEAALERLDKENDGLRALGRAYTKEPMPEWSKRIWEYQSQVEQLQSEVKEWKDRFDRHESKWKEQHGRDSAENQKLREGLESIARNTCCEKCQEAALFARATLGKKP